MIDSLDFSNFKGLAGASIKFAPLTILTGVNGAGKSSVIQALLLTTLARQNAGFVPLNDSYGLALGEAMDLVDYRLGGSEISFTYEIEGSSQPVAFQAKENRRYLELSKGSRAIPILGLPGAFGFSYLAAERNGPRETYDLPSAPTEMLDIGHCGQNAAAVLIELERSRIPSALEHPSTKLRFAKQVEAWLGTFVPNIELDFRADRVLGKAAISFRFAGASQEWVRPGNMGFGVSYCLPIVMAGLLSRPKSLLIVDSPEAHLHPSAQSAMARFLALVAAEGAQVIVETQSDHFLNGIRLAALTNPNLSGESIAINHFARGGEKLVTEISITSHGELTARPTDFFDQTEKDLADIVRLRLGSDSATKKKQH